MVLACAAALLLIGLSGIDRADQLSDGQPLLSRQVIWALLGLPVLCTAAVMPYRKLRRHSYALLAATLPLLVFVLWMPARNGARSWIPLGFFDLQPSELAKLAFILALAQYLSFQDHYRSLTGLIPPFLVALIPAGLILKEPDLGSAMLFLPVLLAMLFAAGARPRHLLLVLCLGLLSLPAFWWGMNAEQRSRITTLFSQRDGGPAPQGDGYHLHQSKQVLSLGGLWGSEVEGVPLDDPAAYHLPAGQTDFVFCWVAERWGTWGAFITLGLYALLFTLGLSIAAATRDPYGRLLAVGIVALLATQTVINAGMTVGLAPIAGITLPLMSYGGSSLIATCVALGLLVNVGLRPGDALNPEPFAFRD
jgi:cell division protein FtsW (lipid II flippase)